MDLEKLSRNNHFEYEISNKAEEDIHLPPMLIQPFLENAIIHGVSGVKNGKIKLSFQEDNNHLLVKIDDNGVGINSKKKSSTLHQSKAISIVEQRLKSISKFRKGELHIKDKAHSSNNVTGTEVIIKIPI
jgi:sensor histidine kinase YesM